MGAISDKLLYLDETKRLLREAINAILADRGEPLLTESDPFRTYPSRLPFTPFNPLDLFANGEQGAWYYPSDLTTLYQDSAGTTPVTADGDPVGLMLDKSGNGNHASQSVSASRPIYRTDGTLHWLEFDGVDDLLTTGAQVIGGVNYYMAAAVANREDEGIGAAFASSFDDGESHVLYADTRTSPRRLARVGGAVRDVYIDRLSKFPSGQTQVLTVLRSATSASGWVNNTLNGTAGTTGSAGDVSDFRIGSYGPFYGQLRFYGGVAIDRLVTELERVSTEQYLATKAGVQL